MNCFVIMSFSTAHASSIYEKWIKKAVEDININQININCHRADKTLRPGEIILHLIDQLATADIVIADLSGQNPNVFYELGVRHTLRNNTILLTQNINDIPFDLRTQRIIEYKYTPDGMLELKESLQAIINEIISTPEIIDNPVKKYLYEKEISKLLSNTTIPEQNAVQMLFNEVTSLRSSFTEQLSQLTRIIEGLTSDSYLKPVNSKALKTDRLLNPDKLPIQKFVGAWFSPETESNFYVENINGDIKMCYCYHGDDELTSHCLNFRFFDNILIANFNWLNLSITGQIYFELKSKDRLACGWWITEDMIKENSNIGAILDLSFRKMSKMTLLRKKYLKYAGYPDWVKKYFELFK